MNIRDDLELIKEFLKIVEKLDCIKNSEPKIREEQYVIVRTYSAGVHCGYLNSIDGMQVILSNARRIWSWKGAFTLSEISQKGINNESKLSMEVPKILLTETIEVIGCSEIAENILKKMKPYNIEDN